jgi:hypothetical protein
MPIEADIIHPLRDKAESVARQGESSLTGWRMPAIRRQIPGRYPFCRFIANQQ